ncbi:zinc-binding dehydrogenase [Cupriavidus basilensis]
MGARVIATASTEAKRGRLAQWCCARCRPTRERWRQGEAGTVPGWRGGCVVFDPVGGDLFDASLRCTAPGGRLLSIGYAGGRIPGCLRTCCS